MKKLWFIAILLSMVGILMAAPLNEGFEGTAVPPAGWEVIYANPNPPAGNLVTHTTDQKHQGDKSFRFSSFSSGAPYETYLITPKLDVTAGDQTVSFYHRNHSSSGTEKFKVGWSSTGKAISDFTWSDEITNASLTWQQYQKTDLPIGTKYVCVQYTSSYQWYLYIDTFKGPEIYSAEEPPDAPTLVSPANEAANQLTNVALNWGAVYGANSYKVFIGTNPEANNVINGTDVGNLTSYVPTGFAWGATYYWTVKAVNQYGDSDPATIRSFTTMADPTITTFPYVQSFEGEVFPPNGWTNEKIAGDGSYIWDVVSSGTYPTCSPQDGTKMLRYYCYYNTAGTKAQLTTAPIAFGDAEYKMSLWLYHYNYSSYPNEKVEIFYGSETDPILTIIRNSATVGWKKHTVALPVASGGETKTIRIVGTSEYGYNIFVDNITIEEIQEIPPLPVTLQAPADNATNIAVRPALSWTPNATGEVANSYKIYMKTDDEVDFELVKTVSSSNYTFEEMLLYDTKYNWYVVASNAYGNSAPSETRSFTTRLDPTRPIPFLEDFNASTAWPSEWINNEMLISATHGNASNGVYKNLYGSETTGSFTTCPIGPLAAVSEIKFDYRYMVFSGYPGAGGHTIVNGDKIEVQISADDGQKFETIHVIDHTNHLVSAEFATPTVPVTGYAGQVVRVRFFATKGNGTGDYYVDFDNIIVRETPSAPVFAIDPIEKDFGITYMPAGSAPQIFTISNDGLGTLIVNSVALGGADVAHFELTDTNTYPVSLATNETITVQARFNPLTAGEKSAVLNVAYNDGAAGSFAAPLTGNAINATITELPYTEGFEGGNTHNSTNILHWTQQYDPNSTYTINWTVNSTETSYNRTPRTGDYNVTLRYNASTWMFRPIQLTGGTTYRFEIYARQNATSGAQLTVKYGNEATVAGMTETIIAQTPITSGNYQKKYGDFTPAEDGLYYLGIYGELTGSPWYLSIDDITISLAPTTPIISISPAEKDFAGIVMDASSTDQTFTITNTGIGPLVLNSASLTGDNANQFVLTDANEYPKNLLENESATIKAKFSPTLEGPLAANLAIVYNDGEDKTANIALTGNGINPVVHIFPYTEDFSGTTFPPLFWTSSKAGLLSETTILTTTTSYYPWSATTWFAHASNHENGKAVKLNIYGTNQKEWLISPSIDLGDNVPGGYKLEFDLAYTAWNNTNPPVQTGIDDKFAVVISTDNGVTWSSLNTLRLWDNAGSEYVMNDISTTGERITINLIGYTGEVKIAFYGESTEYNADNDLHIDNFTITYDATLPVELSAFNTAVLENNTVGLTWVTQSENNLFGYHLHRSEASDLSSAQRITNMLITPTNTSNEATYTYVDNEVLPETTYYYWLQSVESNGTSQFYGPYSIRTNEENIVPELPAITMMHSVYPNPFTGNSSANFGIEVKEGEVAQFVIYNIKGQVVKTYNNINPGKHAIVWDGKDNNKKNCAAGIYFYKLSSPSFSQTKKMMYIK